MRVLVVNAGSSTLKLRLLDGGDAIVADRELDAPRAHPDERQLLDTLAEGLGEADVVGHRVVHGGELYRGAVRVDGEVEGRLRALSELAPLHQPKSIAAIEAVSRVLPGLPAVACFDTAFHATLTPAAATYALPEAWRERWGTRRYGFHGLSHAYVGSRVPQLLGRAETDGLRIVSCHLGAGASLCAIAGGASLDTTMGFTPLDGLVMATRSGAVDPGLLFWLLEHAGLHVHEVSEALEHESGLRGLAGTGDMREVLARADAGDERATLALDVYVHRLRAGIAAMAATLGGIDALAFTGGVGERAGEVRSLAAAGLGFLGVALDEDANASPGGDADVSDDQAAVRTLVVHAREDLTIAREVRALMGAG